LDIFINPPMFNLKFVAGAVGTGAASRFGSGFGSSKTMLLLAALAPQHCLKQSVPVPVSSVAEPEKQGAASFL
jgi:hypothetical protein